MITTTTAASPPPTCTSQFRAPAALESIRFFRSAVATVLARNGVESPRSFGIMLALSEAITNAIEHGSRRGGEVEVTLVWGDTSATIRVTDHGSGSTPLTALGNPASPPDTSIRGRGLVIIHAIADSVTASAVDGGTELSMVFRHPTARHD